MCATHSSLKFLFGSDLADPMKAQTGVSKMYRAYLLVSIFVAVAFASERSEANVTSYSKVSRPYGTYVLMENVTYSTNPTADLMLFYGIGAFRNDSY